MHFVCPELKGDYGWKKHNFSNKLDLSPSEIPDNVERVDVRQISQDDFVQRFDKPKIPVVLTHVQDHWMARKKWYSQVSLSLVFSDPALHFFISFLFIYIYNRVKLSIFIHCFTYCPVKRKGKKLSIKIQIH